MKKTGIFLTFFLAYLYAPCSLAHKLVIALHESPPWADSDPSTGEVIGFEPDLFSRIFSGTEHEPIFTISGYARLVSSFIEKQADIASPIPDAVIAHTGALKLPGYLYYTDVIFGKKKDRLKSLADLEDKRVLAYQRASTILSKEFTAAIESFATYTEHAHRRGQFLMLMLGRADYIVGERNILNALKVELNLENDVAELLVLKHWDIQGATYSPEAHRIFSQGLKELKLSGEYDRLLKKYKIITH